MPQQAYVTNAANLSFLPGSQWLQLLGPQHALLDPSVAGARRSD